MPAVATLTNQAPRIDRLSWTKNADADGLGSFSGITLVLEGAHRLPNLCADEHQPITDGYLRP